MRLFRSEEEVVEWCRANGRPRGATLDVPGLRALAVRWYGDRLDPDWRPRTPAQSQQILEDLGLTGDFWRLPGAGRPVRPAPDARISAARTDRGS